MIRSKRGRRWVAGAVVVPAVLAGALVVNHAATNPTPLGSVPDAIVLAVPASASPPVGPTSQRFGVPTGWRHDPSGAGAAAAAYVRALARVAAAGPLERADVIGAFTTADFEGGLVAATNRQLDDLLFALGARGHQPSDLHWFEAPLTRRIDPHSEDQVEVDIWSLTVVSVAGGSVARDEWNTSALVLVWDSGDWKVARWDSTAGPTPALPTEAELSPVADVRDVAAWAPVEPGGS